MDTWYKRAREDLKEMSFDLDRMEPGPSGWWPKHPTDMPDRDPVQPDPSAWDREWKPRRAPVDPSIEIQRRHLDEDRALEERLNVREEEITPQAVINAKTLWNILNAHPDGLDKNQVKALGGSATGLLALKNKRMAFYDKSDGKWRPWATSPETFDGFDLTDKLLLVGHTLSSVKQALDDISATVPRVKSY